MRDSQDVAAGTMLVYDHEEPVLETGRSFLPPGLSPTPSVQDDYTASSVSRRKVLCGNKRAIPTVVHNNGQTAELGANWSCAPSPSRSCHLQYPTESLEPSYLRSNRKRRHERSLMKGHAATQKGQVGPAQAGCWS